jgi:hypothetical protein
MPTNFWNNPTVEPKRNFRFLLEISNFPDASWLVKTAERPKANVSSTPHQYINHTFNYPGRLVWNPIAITLVDPTEPVDTTKTIDQFLEIAGYARPGGDANTSFANSQSALLKASSVGALGTVSISALSFAAGPILPNHKADSWELKNAFIDGEINFGTFDYASEDLLTVSFSLKYDWANLVAHGNSGE